MKIKQVDGKLQIVLSSLIFSESFIEDMLNMTLIDSGTFTLNLQKFKLQHVFDFVMNIFDPLCAAKNIGLELKVVDSLQLCGDQESSYFDEE